MPTGTGRPFTAEHKAWAAAVPKKSATDLSTYKITDRAEMRRSDERAAGILRAGGAVPKTETGYVRRGTKPAKPVMATPQQRAARTADAFQTNTPHNMDGLKFFHPNAKD